MSRASTPPPTLVLVVALEAIRAAHARLLNPNAPDPYFLILEAEATIELHMKSEALA